VRIVAIGDGLCGHSEAAVSPGAEGTLQHNGVAVTVALVAVVGCWSHASQMPVLSRIWSRHWSQ
jgi:hypothetical protein